ncbi:hypothetical protein [Acetobacter senegalensis]|uniref:hypothetical protein n=1 Tax=Acetobacter senegalensis TaxID=446692 RepID=UPI00128E8C05|nr:hypothetical protein [Acetobacter senegalensis]MCG4258533.1 hypothetical protein [Acetobacter senegalensis]MCG4268430.1 hypothetical protein [Acetobacter senegalensis]MDN7355016.1 hypothetical protein [Acetobacter senegalensis]MPQ72593.1 hypothetical protein [Acetobacter senegalensis]
MPDSGSGLAGKRVERADAASFTLAPMVSASAKPHSAPGSTHLTALGRRVCTSITTAGSEANVRLWKDDTE